MATLTIFSNFFINDSERLQRMKDSFMSFRNIDAQQWIINARGKYKLDALFYLHDNLHDNLSAHAIESGKGWFHDSRELLSGIETDFVLYWVEDHISMVDADKYRLILEEMKSDKCEYLFTSWWIFDQLTKPYRNIDKTSWDNIYTFTVDAESVKRITSVYKDHYIISACGMFSSDLFRRIVNSNHPRLRRWPKETPFDVEKRASDIQWLPLRTAVPKYELFAPIDDDIAGYEGVCLQSRGLYPKRTLRDQQSASRDEPKRIRECLLDHVVSALMKSPVGRHYSRLKSLLRRLSYHF